MNENLNQTSETNENNIQNIPDEIINQGSETEVESTAKEGTNAEVSANELPLPEPDEPTTEETPKTNKDFIIARKEKQLARKAQEAAELKARLEEIERQRTQPQLPNYSVNIPQLPKRDDFDTENDWLEAALTHREQQRIRNEQIHRYDTYVREQKKKDSEALQKLQDEGAIKYNDFEEVIAPILDEKGDFPRNEAVAKAILGSEFGNDILYFFGKNYEHAKKIALMDPISGIKEIVKLEARFKEKQSQKKVTKNEYKPMQSLKGAGNTAIISMSRMESMPQKEFEEFYKQQFGKSKF